MLVVEYEHAYADMCSEFIGCIHPFVLLFAFWYFLIGDTIDGSLGHNILLCPEIMLDHIYSSME